MHIQDLSRIQRTTRSKTFKITTMVKIKNKALSRSQINEHNLFHIVQIISLLLPKSNVNFYKIGFTKICKSYEVCDKMLETIINL